MKTEQDIRNETLDLAAEWLERKGEARAAFQVRLLRSGQISEADREWAKSKIKQSESLDQFSSIGTPTDATGSPSAEPTHMVSATDGVHFASVGASHKPSAPDYGKVINHIAADIDAQCALDNGYVKDCHALADHLYDVVEKHFAAHPPPGLVTLEQVREAVAQEALKFLTMDWTESWRLADRVVSRLTPKPKPKTPEERVTVESPGDRDEEWCVLLDDVAQVGFPPMPDAEKHAERYRKGLIAELKEAQK